MKNFYKVFFLLFLFVIAGAQSNFLFFIQKADARPLTQTPPDWIYQGALYDLDFAHNRYWSPQGDINLGTNNSSSNAARSLISGENFGGNAGSYFAPDTNGILRSFPQYALRVTGYGLWSEAGKNYVLCSRDMTAATCTGPSWVTSNITTTKSGILGADATTGNATKLTASAANGTILQTVSSLTSTVTYTYSAYVERVTGSGEVDMTTNGGSTWTNITSQLSSSAYTMIYPPNTTGATSYQVGFRITTSGDAINVDMNQLENNSYPTSPILTTTSALQRSPEVAYFVGDGTTNPNNAGYQLLQRIDTNTPYTILVQYSGNFTPASPHVLFGDISAYIYFEGGASGGAGPVFNKSATTSNSDTLGLYTLNKAMTGSDGGGSYTCLNGGAVATSSTPYTSASTPGHAAMGDRGQGDWPINGYITRITFWNKLVDQGKFVSYTTVINNQ